MRTSPLVLSKVIFKKCRGVGWESPKSTNLVDTTSHHKFTLAVCCDVQKSCVKTKLCQLFLLELVKQVHGLLTVTYCNRSSLEIITSFHSFQQVYYITSVDFGCGVMNIVVISTQQIQNTSKIINQILQSKNIFFCVLAVQGLCFINKILGRPDQANDSLV